MATKVDVLGENSEREELVGGAVLAALSRKDFRAFVEKAAAATGFPISLITLMGKRSQLFGPSVGLPPELAEVGATDRSVSLCQFVVKDNAAREWEDVALDADAPQGMVHAYSIRSYLGVPLVVHQVPVGALCVADGVPRVISDDQRRALASLGAELSLQLEQEISKASPPRSAALESAAVEPVFGELRNLLGPLGSGVGQAALSNAEVKAAMRLMRLEDSAARERLRAVLVDTLEASADLDEILGELQPTSDRLRRSILAIEPLFVTGMPMTPVADCISNASILAEHLTKLVGGVRLKTDPTCTSQAQARFLVPALALLLGVGSRRLMERRLAGGLDVHATTTELGCRIELHAPLWSSADVSYCVDQAKPLLRDLPSLQLSSSGATMALSLAS